MSINGNTQNPDRVDERDEEGQTLLMIAISSSYWKIANYLIDDAGADLRLPSPHGVSIYTMLSFASDYRSTELLQMKKKLQVI